MGKAEEQVTDLSSEKAEKGKPNLNRASRNKSEKDRRDKVNVFIHELATLVPGCSPQSKKLDKATILKNAVDFMKVHNDLTVAITRKSTNSCLNSDEVGQLMLEGYHAFLFVISLSGSFKFLSESVYDLLGYRKDELIEKNVFDYIVPEDELILMRQLSQDKTGTARNSTGSSSFHIRFKAKVDGQRFYETLRCCGNLRTMKEELLSTDDEGSALSSNETCFVALAKLIQPSYQRNVSNWLSMNVEFTSRQSLDGKFLYLDPRCIPITGYLPYEILGSMIYEFIHFDDLENISTSFEALLENGEGETGNYRILTKGCQWIVIKTSSYISYNHWNSKPEYVCSTHELVRESLEHKSGEKTDMDFGVQVDEISSVSGSDGSSLWTSDESDSDISRLLRKNQAIVNKKNTFASNSLTANTPSCSYTTAHTLLEKTNKGSAEISRSVLQQNSRRLGSRGDAHQMPPLDATEKNYQLSGAGFWSGQDTSSLNARFHNPLAVTPQPRQQITEKFPPSPSNPGSTDRYQPGSPRVSQGYTEQRAQTHNKYPQNTSVWHPAAQSQKSSLTQNEFPAPHLSHGYFPPMPVNTGKTFQERSRKLSGSSQESSSVPPCPADANYSASCEGIQGYQQSSTPSSQPGIGMYGHQQSSTQSGKRIIQNYQQSPTPSPQPSTRLAQGYDCPLSSPSVQPNTGMLYGYEQSTNSALPTLLEGGTRMAHGFQRSISSPLQSSQPDARKMQSDQDNAQRTTSSSPISPQLRMMQGYDQPISPQLNTRLMQDHPQSATRSASQYSSRVLQDYRQTNANYPQSPEPSTKCINVYDQPTTSPSPTPSQPGTTAIQGYHSPTTHCHPQSPEPGTSNVNVYNQTTTSPSPTNSIPGRRMMESYNPTTAQSPDLGASNMNVYDQPTTSPSPTPSILGGRMMQSYQPPTALYSSQSSQDPVAIRGRYLSYTSPICSVESTQTALSPSSSSVYVDSDETFHRKSMGSEFYFAKSLYPPSTKNDRRVLSGGSYTTNTSYPQSPYDHSDGSPESTCIPTGRYFQSSVYSRPQNTIKHPKSPESIPLASPTLPLRHNVLNEQAVAAPRSSPLAPTAVDMTQFAMQQPTTSTYHSAQVKKSNEGSLQSCQVKGDRRSLNTTANLSPELLDTDRHSPEQFVLGNRSQSLEIYPSSRESAPYHGNVARTQGMNVATPHNQSLGERRVQTYQQEQTFNRRPQVSTLNSMCPAKNVNSAHVEAQRILQEQLLQKQNHLQTLLQNQKAQLVRIQEQIIVNAQAQFSLHEVGDLESTKRLQQDVYDLEVERKQQEAKQGELKSLFMQKVNGQSANTNAGAMRPDEVFSSNAVYSPDVRWQHSQHFVNGPCSSNSSLHLANGNPKGDPETIDSSSSSEVAASLNTSQKSHSEVPSGLSRNYQGFNEEDLFRSVLQPDERQVSLPVSVQQPGGRLTSLSCQYYTPELHRHSITSHCKPLPDIALAHANSSDFNERRQNNTFDTLENTGSNGNQAKDYFSKFSASELETFLSTPSFVGSSTPADNSPSEENVEKEETAAPSTYDSLLLQQKRLLEMQEEQRRQLVKQQQEQLLILQQQQQQQQRLLVGLQRTTENTEQNIENHRILESQVASRGDITVDDPSSVLSQELSDEDLSVVNMLLAEVNGSELWTDEIFDKNTSET